MKWCISGKKCCFQRTTLVGSFGKLILSVLLKKIITKSWLLYSTSKDSLFCLHCKVFGDGKKHTHTKQINTRMKMKAKIGSIYCIFLINMKKVKGTPTKLKSDSKNISGEKWEKMGAVLNIWYLWFTFWWRNIQAHPRSLSVGNVLNLAVIIAEFDTVMSEYLCKI